MKAAKRLKGGTLERENTNKEEEKIEMHGREEAVSTRAVCGA